MPHFFWQSYPFERIDGCVKGNERQAAIDRFSRPESDRFVFLLCTKVRSHAIMEWAVGRV